MYATFAFLACAAHLPLGGATTNDVDMAALIAAVDAGLSVTNGWTISGLAKYAKGVDYASNPACVKFDSKGDWLESVDFGARIVGIGFAVRCSATNNATRSLHVRNDAGDDIGVVAACSRANRCESQFLAFGQDVGCSRFRIVLAGSGNTGVWGVGEMFVVTADPVFAPTGLAVVRTNANYCVLAWENGANTVSNRVDTLRVERGAGEDVIFETGFDGFDRSDSSIGNKDLSGQLATLLNDARISGERIYAADGTNGVCQMGTTERKGFLRFSGVSDWSNVELRLVLKKHDYSGDANKMQFAWETDVETNMFKEITISTEFTEYVVKLSSAQPQIPSNASIVIGYFSTVGGNRRVLIDSLSIVNLSDEVKTQIDSRFISAAPGQTRFRLPFDLAPKAEYRFSVRAVNGDGIVSDETAVEVRALRPQGTVYSLR